MGSVKSEFEARDFFVAIWEGFQSAALRFKVVEE